MNIWTKTQFKTQSKKIFSKRDGTIAQIDTKLDEYHGEASEPEKGTKLEELWQKIVDFEVEKKAKHQADPTKQSKKRKNAVHTLRAQVEWHMWQRKYEEKKKERDDLRDFFSEKRDKEEDDKVLREWLEKLKIQVKQGDTATSTLKKDLHSGIEDFFKPVGHKRWMDGVATGKFPWASTHDLKVPYIGKAPKYDLPSNLRVATVDMESALGDGAFTYVGMDKDALTAEDKTAMFYKILEDKDSMISYLQSQNQVAEYFPAALRQTMEDYLRSLLKVDLSQQSQLVQRALASEKGFRAIVHLDYYATRAVDQVGLHKDTTGHNLFAVLNYINDDPMLGPEYIDDPAPIRTVNPGYYRDALWSELEGYKRSGAPWAEVGDDKYVWPQALIEALSKVRRFPPNEDSKGKLAASMLPKDGLVSFVDELIFHATPIAGHRHEVPWANTHRYLHAGVTFPTLVKGKYPALPTDILHLFEPHVKVDRVQRRMSAHYSNEGVHLETGLLVPGAKSGGVRKFFRLWICIVPKHWYTSLPAYT